jgi:hypothetical protein
VQSSSVRTLLFTPAHLLTQLSLPLVPISTLHHLFPSSRRDVTTTPSLPPLGSRRNSILDSPFPLGRRRSVRQDVSAMRLLPRGVSKRIRSSPRSLSYWLHVDSPKGSGKEEEGGRRAGEFRFRAINPMEVTRRPRSLFAGREKKEGRRRHAGRG